MSLDLADRAAVNERVAKAMGWEYRGKTGCRHHWRRWTGAGWSHNYGSRTDYLSDDPALNREMRDKLCAVSMRMEWNWARTSDPTFAWIVTITMAASGNETRPRHAAVGATEAEALVRALEAAGLLKEEC